MQHIIPAAPSFPAPALISVRAPRQAPAARLAAALPLQPSPKAIRHTLQLRPLLCRKLQEISLQLLSDGWTVVEELPCTGFLSERIWRMSKGRKLACSCAVSFRSACSSRSASARCVASFSARASTSDRRLSVSSNCAFNSSASHTACPDMSSLRTRHFSHTLGCHNTSMDVHTLSSRC
jgi:hypothetical protein